MGVPKGDSVMSNTRIIKTSALMLLGAGFALGFMVLNRQDHPASAAPVEAATVAVSALGQAKAAPASVEAPGPGHILHDGQAPTFLFVLSSEDAQFDNDTLTLGNISSHVVYFSDRPHRIAGHMGIDEFIEMWSSGDDSFKNDPPNAALSILSKNGADTPIIEILDPKKSGHALSLKVKVIAGEVPKSMGPVSVFVDTFVMARRGPFGAAAAVRGPLGGRAVGIRGPYGGAAVGVRGPYGGAAIGVRRPFSPIGHGAMIRPW
jgi:hypothetical protein